MDDSTTPTSYEPKDAHLLKTDVYVDAAFACGWGVNVAQILIMSNLVLDIPLRSQVVQYCEYLSCKQQFQQAPWNPNILRYPKMAVQQFLFLLLSIVQRKDSNSLNGRN